MDDQAAVKAPLPVRVPGAALRELLRIKAVKSRPAHSPGAGVASSPPNYACTYGRCLAPVVLSPTNHALPFPQSLMQATVLSDWSRNLSNEDHAAGQCSEGRSIPVPQEFRTPVTTAEIGGRLGPAIARALDRLRDKPLERQLHALADPRVSPPGIGKSRTGISWICPIRASVTSQ